MTPHKKSEWLEGGDACLECSEDWPCRDMRIWQAGYRAGLEEAKAMLGDSDGDIDFLLFKIKAKLKEQS